VEDGLHCAARLSDDLNFPLGSCPEYLRSRWYCVPRGRVADWPTRCKTGQTGSPRRRAGRLALAFRTVRLAALLVGDAAILGATFIGARAMTQFFDAVIIGAGQAGPSLAGRLTAAGMNVALVERKLFGGTCVNTGCMPTKTLVASAYAAQFQSGPKSRQIIRPLRAAVGAQRIRQPPMYHSRSCDTGALPNGGRSL